MEALEQRQKSLIKKTALSVLRGGLTFSDWLRRRRATDADYAFLSGGLGSRYYEWCLSNRESARKEDQTGSVGNAETNRNTDDDDAIVRQRRSRSRSRSHSRSRSRSRSDIRESQKPAAPSPRSILQQKLASLRVKLQDSSSAVSGA
jgi:hypothetical protein